MSKHKILFPIFIVAIASISCNQKSNPSNDKEVTFTNDIQPIITENCTNRGCHHGGEQFSLLTYEDVIKNGYVEEGNPKDNVLYQFLTSKNTDERMPPQPFPALSDEQLQLVHDWIYQGATR